MKRTVSISAIVNLLDCSLIADFLHLSNHPNPLDHPSLLGLVDLMDLPNHLDHLDYLDLLRYPNLQDIPDLLNHPELV